MATFTKFNAFVENVAEGVCTLDDDDKYVCLCNTAPVAANSLFTDLTEITAANGYTAKTTTNSDTPP